MAWAGVLMRNTRLRGAGTAGTAAVLSIAAIRIPQALFNCTISALCYTAMHRATVSLEAALVWLGNVKSSLALSVFLPPH